MTRAGSTDLPRRRGTGLAARTLVVVVPLLLLLLTGAPTPARADTTSDELAKAEQRAQLIDQVRGKLSGNLADALAAQEGLNKSLQSNTLQQHEVTNHIGASEQRIAALDHDIDVLDHDIADLSGRIEVERAELKVLARAIYTQPNSVLLMMAEASSLGDLMTRVTDLRSAGERAQALRARLDVDVGQLRSKLAKQQGDRDAQVQLRDGLRDYLAKLEDLRARQERSKVELSAKLAQTKQELDSVVQQSAELAKQIADLLEQQQNEIIAAATQQVWDQVRLQEVQPGGVAVPAISGGHSKKYRFIWPEPLGVISQGYGPSSLAFEPSYQGVLHFHTGIDLVLPMGSPILAADDGVVRLVGGGQFGYGNYVVIAHAGGLTTLYGHLDKALVKVGDVVKQRQVIGLEGSTGNSTGPHLHFELRIDGKAVDPTPYLPPGPPAPVKE